MKKAIVSPILKSNRNKNIFSSYRCVSVQTNIYRIFELILLDKMLPYVNAYEVIPITQYGYKRNNGLHNIHIDLQKTIFDTFNNENYIGIDVIFLDFSDAFDTVCHKKLL